MIEMTEQRSYSYHITKHPMSVFIDISLCLRFDGRRLTVLKTLACSLAYSFENFGLLFDMADIMATGRSSVCSITEFHVATYFSPSSTV